LLIRRLSISRIFPLLLEVAFLVLLVESPLLGQREVPLKIWIKVTGPYYKGYERMGLYVTGIPAGSPNLKAYRGTVSRNGRTNFYTLKDSLDTEPAYSIRGEHLLLGDLNSDGLTDAVVSNTVGGLANDEKVIVYWGIPEGFDTLHALTLLPDSVWEPFRPACLADVNNDGRLDLLTWDDRHNAGYGEIQVRFGPNISQSIDRRLQGDAAYRELGFYGADVAVADLNTDGYNDLVVRGVFGRLADSSWVRIYWGRPSSSGAPLDTLSEIHGGYGSYYPVVCLDVNGDGIADLLRTDTGLPFSGGLTYHVFVHLGGPQFSTEATFKFENPGRISQFGYSLGSCVVNAGDMNGDGYDDIAVGAYEADPVDGFVFVFGGGPRVDGRFDAAIGSADYSDFGYSIAPIGDVNGDGVADLLVGAPGWYFGDDQGAWAVVLGSNVMKVTSVQRQPTLVGDLAPSIISLAQNYPNPFNPTTTIQYTTAGTNIHPAAGSHVRLAVFDLLGREVARLMDNDQAPGTHSVVFNGVTLAAGVYTYRLSVGNTIQARRMILIK
jgi:hypothetical protein